MAYKTWIIIEDISGERDWDGEFSLTGQDHDDIEGVLDEIWRILWTANSPAQRYFEQEADNIREWAKEKAGDPISPQPDE
jgi:hypothetical protein